MLDKAERGRANNLNLIRLTLASLVVFSHSFAIVDREPLEPTHRFLHFGASLGDIAVFGFFFLSGFLILKSAIRNPDPASFLRARTLRIFPGLLATALFCTVLVGPVFGLLAPSSYFQNRQTWVFFVGTVAMNRHAGVLPGLFTNMPWKLTNLPLWTLSLEWCMYMVALLAGLVLQRHRLRAVAPASWLLLLLALAFTAQTFPLELHYGYKAMLCFLVGSAAYLFRHRVPLVLSVAVPLFLVDLVLVRFLPIVGKAAFLPCFFYFLLVIGFHPSVYARCFHRFGDLSYGTYIYAWPIQQILGSHLHSPYVLSLASFPVTLLIAAASWYLLESPSLSLKSTARPQIAPPTEAVSPEHATT